jgi:hypothetical protein
MMAVEAAIERAKGEENNVYTEGFGLQTSIFPD